MKSKKPTDKQMIDWLQSQKNKINDDPKMQWCIRITGPHNGSVRQAIRAAMQGESK